ncbi:MAG: hypothetical protein Q8L60_13670 [Gammaproteobacteria bacterium]|nr:hypothetical protein [Gammaproteobacteria bacterium]MDP2348939.1 hypothetical protein [Gammaproteobacteria bacterium]
MAITVATRTEIISLVVGMFSAAPGAAVLDDLSKEILAGSTMKQLAAKLALTAEFKGLFPPSAMTNSEFATKLVQQLVGNEVPSADKAAAAVEITALLTAGASRSSVIVDVIAILRSVPETHTVWGAGAASFNNKVEVAEYFSVTKLQSGATLEVLQNVISGVGSSQASVDTAIAGINNEILQGTTYALTAGVDGVQGTNANDIITGIFGDATNANNTYNAGDVIDGAAGTDILNLIAQGTTASTAAAIVKNVETINILDTVGATFNAALVENAPAINFTNTQTGNTSTVNGAAQASVIGLAGKGSLTVDYATTSAVLTNDAAKLSLTAVGTSTTARSTVNVSDGNTIDTVSIATTGSNFVTLTAGTAAKTVTITGSGTNNFDVSAAGAVAAVVTLDASAATGANTFVMGDTLNTTDVIKGGSGADTVTANLKTATLVSPTMTSIETLSADFDAAGTIDLSGSVGLKTVTLTGSSENQTLTKAASTVTTLNVSSQTSAADTNNVVAFGFATASALTVNVGSAAATATNMTIADLQLTKVNALTLNGVGTKVNDINSSIDLSAGLSALTISAAAGSTFEHQGVMANGNIGPVKFTIGAEATYSGGVYAEGDIGDVTITLGTDSYFEAWLDTDKGSVGNITVTGTGELNMGMGISGGDLGNVSITLDGDGAANSYFGALVSGGSIGNISVSVDNGASIGIWVSAQAYDYEVNGGHIGNITLSIGEDSHISGNFEAETGDIGNISISLHGDDSTANLWFEAQYVSGDPGTGQQYIRGGNIGNINIQMAGDDSYLSAGFEASGGSIGTVTIALTGEGAEANLYLAARQPSDTVGAPSSNDIGAITITSNDEAEVYMYLYAENTIGAITANMGDDSDLYINFSGGGNDGEAVFTGLTVTMGHDADFDLRVSGYGGEIGNITGTFGNRAEVDIWLSDVSGDIGSISITAGNAADIDIFLSGNGGDVGNISVTAGNNSDVLIHASGSNGDIGSITLTGGDSSSDAEVYFTDPTGSIAGITATAWNGFLTVNLSGVTLGTSIAVGGGGSSVRGTEGADNILLGAKTDTVVFDSSPTAIDTIFNFTTGSGTTKDVLDVSNSIAGGLNATVFSTNPAVTVLATNTIIRLADIAGGNDITTAAGLTAALNAGGEFANIDATEAGATVYTFITSASTSSSTFYVFNAASVDATFDFSSVTLVGVVNAVSGGLSGLNIANFA